MKSLSVGPKFISMDAATLGTLVIGMQAQSARLDAQAQLTRKAIESDASVLLLLEAVGATSESGSSSPSGTGSIINLVA